MRMVKSAVRVLDILEFFAVKRAPASASEVERALELPQSSTSVLLHTLVSLGYLEHLPHERKFRPTARVTVLGDWIDYGFLDRALTKRLDALHRVTRESIILGRQQNAQVQFVYVRLPDRNHQVVIRKGSLEPICLSAVGRALLSTHTPASARKLLRRNNAEAATDEDRVSEHDLFAELDTIRATGIAETSPKLGRPRHFHVIACLLPLEEAAEPMAVGVAGPKERILRNRTAIIAALQSWTNPSTSAPVAGEAGTTTGD